MRSLLLVAACALSACTSTTARLKLPPLTTVEKVDLPRYLGTWFEIASFPQGFQKGCTGTQATYSRKEGGDVDVLNRCHLDSLTGPERAAHGTARVVDSASTAKLEVSFFGPFWGPYWVIDLGADYEFAVVGHPGRDYLWILSRTPTLDPQVYAGIVARLEAKGYQVARLEKTLQVAAP